MAIDKKLLAQVKQAAQDIQSRVRIVLPYKGQYLLETLSNPKWPENLGKRRFIGGGVEEGETPEQAAARELFEELGIKVDPSRFKAIGKNPDKQHEHYLQLKRHGLKPGEYKTSVGSDPIIYLNKGLPQGDDYTGADLAKLLNVKTSADIFPSLPGTPLTMHPPIPGKATGPTVPFPSTKKMHRPSKNFASGLQMMKIPKGFENDTATADAMLDANYRTPEMPQQVPGQQPVFNSNRATTHQNISRNIVDQEAYNAETRRQANAALSNRMGTFWTISHNPNAVDQGEIDIRPSAARAITVPIRASEFPWPESFSTGVTVSHEAEHSGAQTLPTAKTNNFLYKMFDYSPMLPQDPNIGTLKVETPAVLAEYANAAQSAYLTGGKKPLTGTMSIAPDGGFKVPLETFRREVERRGHVGGAQNVSMTDLLNSPEGQEYLRMNMQRERIRRMREQGQ